MEACDSGVYNFSNVADSRHSFSVYAVKNGADPSPATFVWDVDFSIYACVEADCSPLDLSITATGSGPSKEAFVQAANTAPADYNEYRNDDLATGVAWDVDTTTFNDVTTEVVAIQVTVREQGSPPSAPLFVRGIRCPVAAQDPLSQFVENDVHFDLQRLPGAGGLNVGSAGVPLGFRTCMHPLAPGEVSRGFAQNFSDWDLDGIVHTKYTGAEAGAGGPLACCGVGTQVSCCEWQNACIHSPTSTRTEAMESSYARVSLNDDDCLDINMKSSPQISASGSPSQGWFPECVDADDIDHKTIGHIACTGMVVTHVRIGSDLKELRDPYWTRYAMDGQVGASSGCSSFGCSNLLEVYADATVLGYDCMNFTVSDVNTPVSAIQGLGEKCTGFSDTDGSGVFDCCENAADPSCTQTPP